MKSNRLTEYHCVIMVLIYDMREFMGELNSLHLREYHQIEEPPASSLTSHAGCLWIPHLEQ